MPILKPISGHGSTGGIRRYLEKGGRALARDLFNLSYDERDAGALRGIPNIQHNRIGIGQYLLIKITRAEQMRFKIGLIDQLACIGHKRAH